MGIWILFHAGLSGYYNIGTAPAGFTVAGVADFNRDDNPDIIWENLTTGERRLWYMDRTTKVSEASFGTVATPWRIAATGDFNGNGHADIVWQRVTTGDRGIWLLFNIGLSGYIPLPIVSTDWEIAN